MDGRKRESPNCFRSAGRLSPSGSHAIGWRAPKDWPTAQAGPTIAREELPPESKHSCSRSAVDYEADRTIWRLGSGGRRELSGPSCDAPGALHSRVSTEP